MNRAPNPSAREVADHRPTKHPSENASTTLGWSLTFGALIAICGGSVAAVLGNVWSAPIVVGGLAALMHGQNPRGVTSLNLALGRARYREDEQSDAPDGSAPDRAHADIDAPDGSASNRPPLLDASSQETKESARVVPLRREVSSAQRRSVAGVSAPRRSRPHKTAGIAEEGHCPKCGRVALQMTEDAYYCEDCPLAFPARS